MYENYELRYAAAYVRGYAASINDGEINLPGDLLHQSLTELTEDEMKQLVDWGKEHELKLYHFKKQPELLPRVKRALGFLKSVQFDSLLDVGSGRGVFLLPFLQEFPWVSVDILPRRVTFLENLRRGGVGQLTALQGDICDLPLPEKSYDVVTMLEVLEHIPEVEKAVSAAVRLARKHVVVTVPSKEDNNPEHIHLLTKQRLTELFEQAGCERLRFDGVNGHLFLVATIG